MSNKYQYSYVKLDEVINNPEEYIIPECLNACKKLWDKNIETFMVSNYDDNNLYILIMNESDENRNIFKKKIFSDNRYFYDSFKYAYGIRVNGMDDKASKELEKLTEVFKLQDTKRFKSIEDYLEDYKHTGGSYYIDGGTIYMGVNPALVNKTLEEALKDNNQSYLYIPSEGRVYENELYLKWHNKFINNRLKNIYNILNNINNNKNNSNINYSNLRDFFIKGELDYVEEILQGEFLKEIISDYNNKSSDELYNIANKTIDDFNNGRVSDNRIDEMEQRILFSLLAIKDNDDINNISL